MKSHTATIGTDCHAEACFVLSSDKNKVESSCFYCGAIYNKPDEEPDLESNKYNLWLEIPEEIMAVSERTEFYRKLNRFLVEKDPLYRIKYTEGNHVKVCKGFII